MSLFRRGLKENIKDELMRDGAEISNLEILIERAIAIDDKLYFRAMEKNSERSMRGRAGYAPNPGSYRRTSSYPQEDPMELDNL